MAKKTGAMKGELHPDVLYVEQGEIGKVICEGLAAVVKAQPKNPVEYLARWLLAYEDRDKTQHEVDDVVDGAVGAQGTEEGGAAKAACGGAGEDEAGGTVTEGNERSKSESTPKRPRARRKPWISRSTSPRPKIWWTSSTNWLST
jgi:hypothetical protein